ncbi:uncharacterized protein LOC122616557 [Drosophila teissieri]|uniref:uncharacterized protein LOC122616557 n=1 Tax=Drosophila teissieri TaxID=7243 RepID=UPI001CB9E352|nr:uncharacterized protein LOC122616557 [Drosophila teissieri]
MISHSNTYTIMAFSSTVAWILTVVGLFVGLSKGRPTLLVFWLLFTSFATDAQHFKHWTISYLGIFYEVTCLYLVFRYFRRLYSYMLLEGDNYDATFKGTEDYKGNETETETETKKGTTEKSTDRY